jgi:hypothetical protein
MKRYDHVKAIYNRLILNDLFISLADTRDPKVSTDIPPEDIEDWDEWDESFTPPEDEEERISTEIPPEDEKPATTEMKPEDVAITEVPPEKEEEYIKFPSTQDIEPGTEQQLGFAFAGKKYRPGAVLAKVCPLCKFKNRPIYLNECENCKRIYARVLDYIGKAQTDDPDYTEDQAFKDLAPSYSYAGPKQLGTIFENLGITPITNKNIQEIEPSNRKMLEDIMWYRLNTKKDPVTGDTLLDKTGKPVKLDKNKYFSARDISKTLHMSEDRFQYMVDQHNTNIVKNLPEQAQKLIRRDEDGEIIPSSLRALSRYGIVGPAVSIKQSGPAQRDISRVGPKAKSIEISAWNWDTLGPVFGWDKGKGKFTHGWGKYLEDTFLPQLKIHKLENAKELVERAAERYRNIANLQYDEVREAWEKLPLGVRIHAYFRNNPGESIKEFVDEWKDEFTTYMENDHPVIQRVQKIEQKLPDNVLDTLRNYDKRKIDMTDEVRNALVSGLAKELNVKDSAISKHLGDRDRAKEALENRPPEMDYMLYLMANPKTSVEKIEKKHRVQLSRFMQGIYKRKSKAAEEMKRRVELMEKKLPSIEKKLAKIKEQGSEPLDIAESVKKFDLEQKERKHEDPELAQLKKDIEQENPTPEPTGPQSKAGMIHSLLKINARTIIVNNFLKLSDDKQLSLFGLPPEEEEKEKVAPQTGVQMWEARREFVEEQNGTYNLDIVFYLGSEPSRQKSSFTWTGRSPFSDELKTTLQDLVGSDAVDKSNIFVTITDPYNSQKTLKFVVSDNVVEFVSEIGIGSIPKVTVTPKTELPSKEKLSDEEAKEMSTEDFGKERGRYSVTFKWSPDYNQSIPGSEWTGYFHHTPGHRKVDFEGILKEKIEKRFKKTLLPLIGQDDKTTKKYMELKVIEPNTNRARHYSIVVNKSTKEFIWYGADPAERKEKQRRLEYPEFADIKKEVNLGLLGLEDIELSGTVHRPGLRVIKKGPEDIEEQQEKYEKGLAQYEKRRKSIKQIRDMRLMKELKSKEKLTPEEKAKLEELRRMEEEELQTPEWTPPKPEYIETTKPVEAPNIIEKVVAKRGFIRKQIESKHPITHKPIWIRNPATGEMEKQMEEGGMIPKVDHYLVRITMDEDGNPRRADCSKIGVTYKRTGGATTLPKYKDLISDTRKSLKKEKSKLKGQERVEEINKRYTDLVKSTHGEDANPWKPARELEPYVADKSTSTPYKECPAASYPFEGACEEISMAIKSHLGETIPGNFKVWNYSEIEKKPERETSKEITERRRRKDVTDLYSDDN